MKKMKRWMGLLLAICLTVSLLPVYAAAEETTAVVEKISAQQITEKDLKALAGNLPEIIDTTGTDFYFYNQLNDVEKAFYWLIQNLTLEQPTIRVSELKELTIQELWSMASRALTAVVADYPEFHIKWGRYGNLGEVEGDMLFSLDLMPVWSEYREEKANARLRQLVTIIGPEGDRYSIVRDMLDLLATEMYYADGAQGSSDCAMGCLLYGCAVCAGFSDLVKILCNVLNIPCVVIGNAGHAWNYIQMEDGLWYAVDASRCVTFDFAEQPVNLVGSNSPQYAGEGNYSISDPYLGAPGDFTFPTLAETEYIYVGKYEPTYHDAPGFVEPEARFIYRVNEDGKSCTVTGFEGAQNGDLVIPEKIDGYIVTAIGDYAFFGCSGFKGNLILADSIMHIGVQSFDSCSGFTGQLHLPENLKAIGEKAFSGTSGFSGELVLPDGVTSVGDLAFYCAGFGGELFLPDGVQWGNRVVSGSRITGFSVNEANPNYSVVDGVLYSKDLKTLIACPSYKSGELRIPAGVEVIADGACVLCDRLTGQLVLPDGLRIIEGNAFGGCNGFTGDLTIPDSVAEIGAWAFVNCGGFDGALQLPGGLVRIEEYAFSNCPFTGELIIPETVIYIGQHAFSGLKCGLHIPNSVEYIGAFAFEACVFTNCVDLSNSHAVIEEGAFFGTSFEKFACNCAVEMSCDIMADNSCELVKYFGCGYCGGQYMDMETRLEHMWVEASCTTAKHCARCEKTEGSQLGHVYANGVCTRCGCEEQYRDYDTGIGALNGTHTYRWFSGDFTWTEAKNACESMGGHLLTVTSEEEHELIMTILEPQLYVWFGARMDENGQWGWVTGEEWGYSLWKGDAPSNADENCGVWYSWKWCGSTDLTYGWSGFVCEWDELDQVPEEFRNTPETPDDPDVPYDPEGPAIPIVPEATDDRMLLNGHAYQVFAGNLSWAEAQKACEAMGGHLISITNSREQEVVSKLARERLLWIGAMLDESGLWSWATGEEWTYSNWCEGEPSGGGENRGLLDYGGWNDVVDRYLHTEGFICEWDDLSKLPDGFQLPSDMNGDGEINNKDATRLFQYMTDWNVEVVEAALDVNGDGKVNNKDATRLFQYLSGWDVEIY